MLIFGPVCFGATEPWSLLVVELGSIGVLLLWIVLSWHHLRVQIDLPIVVLLLFGALMASQLFLKVTVYRYATEQELLKIIAYFVFFFLARHLFVTLQGNCSIARFLALFGGAEAVFAIVQKLQGNGQIYWTRTTNTQSFFGAYANKNHYAGLMEMLLPFALAGAADTTSEISLRAISAFAAGGMVASVFLSGSRTGTLVIMMQLGLFAGRFLLKSRRGSRSWVSMALVAFAMVLVIWISGDALKSQTAGLASSATEASMFNRLQVARDSVELVKQRPILGWGLGTFSTVYPKVATWYSDFAVNAAHDDYLQLTVETGMLGLVLLLLFLVLVFRVGIGLTFDEPASTVSAAMFGCLGLLLHSLTDFNLHVPANAAIFFALCGMICSASETAPPAQSTC